MKPLHHDAWRYIEYLNFKMQCAADQEKLKWKVDVPKAEALLETLETIEKEKHAELVKSMPKKIDWAGLSEYEKDDNTAAMQTMACTGDACEIVDIT